MISLSQIRLSYGDRTIFQNADLLIRAEDRIGLVGSNGAGKSSLFRIIAGEETPYEGDYHYSLEKSWHSEG